MTAPAAARASSAQADWCAGRPTPEPDPGAALHQLVDLGLLDLPQPGAGRTRERWSALAALAEHDLALVRLAEGHADAIAILTELGGPSPEDGQCWGVWAAEPPAIRLTATPEHAGWRLSGRKAWCSGAGTLTHALVTAAAPDGPRLFALPLSTDGVAPVTGSWPALGMAGSDSRTVEVHDVLVPAEAALGGPRAYLDRPGFWHGGAGVAACWYGGAVGVAKTLLATAGQRALDPHALAHLGGVDALLAGLRALFVCTAAAMDADPRDEAGRAQLAAERVRAAVEAGASEVMIRVGRALGAAPLALDVAHARRVADLSVYLRQSHAERDLAGLAGTVLATSAGWQL